VEAHGHVTAADVDVPDVSDDGAPETDVIDQEPASRGHGSESFFILGEGLVSTSRGGREDAPAQPVTAATAAAQAPPFRFTRSGPKGGRISRPARRKIAKAMTDGGGTDSDIPAGYTYLGQFIDHDLTFDRTDVMLGEDIAPPDMLQGRSPSLDLDSLYGAGPDDPVSEKFYEADGKRLKMGKTQGLGGPPFQARDGFDLPRHPERKKATIPDFRNDENLVVAQTHLAFIRFHNRVVAELADVPAGQRFKRARRQVTKHYQWMVRHDYLPRICDPGVVDDVFANGRKFFEVGADPTEVPTMPVEFSVAAFRLGHSMIRAKYNWNLAFDNGDGGASLAGLSADQRAALTERTPLWFYVLREAEFNGGKLRGVGARIVAETFHRAIEGSQFSIVRDPAWRPTLGPNSTTFRMVDLLLFAFEGKKTLLAPVG